MINKKLEAKRLVIFLLLAFALSWIPAILFNQLFGYHEWFETNKMPVLFWFVGYGPALANVITRKLTNEGWHDSMLHLRLKGNLKYYLIAILLVSVMSIPQGILATLVYGNGDFSDLGQSFTWQESISTLILILSTSPLIAFNTFGEEFGWRGYMNQKMEPLIGTTGTVVVGGIIWGLWHAELTVEGHNFGTDYAGYPYLGILAMCVMCTFWGMVLMWLTKKTGSIYPAAIFHAMVNNGGSITAQLFLNGISEEFVPTIPQQLILSIPTFLICFVFLILMLRDHKQQNAAALPQTQG
ncbi:MAG: CPBP family intramembrane metalloprotease [Oscillospiraceae bacterium]|nr:CPBP family intramembrane metalloprotease [Oscillospiraceae bacterium]